MDDLKFWLQFWKYAIIGSVTIALATIGSCQMTNYRIVELSKVTKDPFMANCALTNNVLDNNCIIFNMTNEVNKDGK